MNKLLIAALGSASLLAVPALAQTSTSNQTQNSTAATSPEHMQQERTKITQDLQRDGYKNIQVVPDSFLVHAVNKRGEPVVMIINPDSVFAVTQLPANQANNGPNGSASGNGALGASPNNNNNNSTK